jgi:DNA-binding XRE family transcriptional regulator
MNQEGAGGLAAEAGRGPGAEAPGGAARAGNDAGAGTLHGARGPGEEPGAARLPVMPGFREMALRRMSQDRGRLVRELAARRQETGLSQTEVAARMGTSQSAVARLESGGADVRASTLERYAAALGTEITWTVQD